MGEIQPDMPALITRRSDENRPVIPEARIDAVINREVANAEQAQVDASALKTGIVQNQEVLGAVNKGAGEKEVEYLGINDKVNQREEIRAGQEKKLFGLGALFGKKSRSEERADDFTERAGAEKGLGEAEAVVQGVENKVSEMEEDMGQAELKQRHAETLVEANKKSGPVETSGKMSEALEGQDSVKFYVEAGYPVEKTKYLLPMSVVERLMEEMQELPEIDSVESFQRQYKRVADMEKDMGELDKDERFEKSKDYLRKLKKDMKKDIVDNILNMTPVYEELIKLVDKEGIPVSQNLIVSAMVEGMKIARGSVGEYNREAWDFARAKSEEGSVTASDIGYYTIGASQLDKFFGHRKNIQGRNRLPYVMAYTAGVLCSRPVAHTAHHFRGWVAETIPFPQTEHVRENGEWVAKQTEPVAKGFGYAIGGRYNMYELTNDVGWQKAVEEANLMAVNVSNTLKENRRFEAKNKFVSGMGTLGNLKFKEPVLNK